MRIIFSRKGFDQSAGGFASPIFPDGTLFSVPIPDNRSSHCYDGLAFQYQGTPIQEILNQITNGTIHNNKKTYECDYTNPMQGCHHDPMVLSASNRLVLGQTGKSESHLRGQGVGCGDIFLFYGWFRAIEQADGRWIYKRDAANVHVIWSYMTVLASLPLDTDADKKAALIRFPELQDHPHLIPEWASFPNGIYVSKEYALFSFSAERCLTDTKNYVGRATWRLPGYFNRPQAFSHLKAFTPEGDSEVVVRYRGRGQEFVLDLEKIESDADRQMIMRYVRETLCNCVSVR